MFVGVWILILLVGHALQDASTPRLIKWWERVGMDSSSQRICANNEFANAAEFIQSADSRKIFPRAAANCLFNVARSPTSRRQMKSEIADKRSNVSSLIKQRRRLPLYAFL
jgi:hypothetical protein